MDGPQLQQTSTALDVFMVEPLAGDVPTAVDVEPVAAVPLMPAASANVARPLKRPLPVENVSTAAAPDPSDMSSPASTGGYQRSRRAAKNGKKNYAPVLEDDFDFYAPPAGKRASSLAALGESSTGATAVAASGAVADRPLKSDGRSRSLALGGALNGTPGDPKGKGKAIVHGGDNKIVPNEDFCQVCQGKGRFICCDGCPHSFHLTCLDPPMDNDSVPDKDSLWFCRDCHLAQGHIPTPQPPPTIFGQLLSQLEESSPAQFQLPNEVKAHFKGVAVAPNGAYVDGDRLRPMKADRRGFAEERDLHRLKDVKGLDVLCYKCGGSAAPLEGAVELRAAPLSGEIGVEVSRWRKIISCDYCALHWHFDCLDPPMTAVPQVTHKWMCPNHAEHVMPKLRIPKQGLSLVDVTGPGEYNNGHIEILPAPEAERIAYEDVVLSNKRYRVPEQSIIVDFWSKVLGRPRAIKLVKTSGAGGLARGVALSNRSGSPLTSLDSDSEDDSDIASVASSSDLSTLRSEAGESIANGETLAAPVDSSQFPLSFSQLVDATILSPALDAAALPAPSANKKIILRLSRANGSGSPPKTEGAVAVAAPAAATTSVAPAPALKPSGDSGSSAMAVHLPLTNGHLQPSTELAPSADIDEEPQMRIIRELINAIGKDKLIAFLEQS